MRWLACELHTHTVHSDGRQTLQELGNGAARLGFDCLALTDHNTMSGLADKQIVEQSAGIFILPGMEWTTFHGHMVTIGLDDYVDWREAQPANIHDGVAAVHRHGGLAGLAHPFRIGSPACTGCYWEYAVQDWNDFDYIEVWSGTFAPIKTDNSRAFSLWTDKLNEGHRIAATSGRDWHEQADTEEPISVTYLGVKNETTIDTEQAVAALRQGRVSVTIGPLVNLEVISAAQVYGLGSIVPAGEGAVTAQVSIDCTVRSGLWALPHPDYHLILISNKGVIADYPLGSSDGLLELQAELPRDGLIWMRAELRGIVRGIRTMVAFTNPVYFE